MKKSAVDDEKAERAKIFLLLPSPRAERLPPPPHSVHLSVRRSVGRSLGNDAFS